MNTVSGDFLSGQINFKSLSLKDLLEARDQYHWHLMNKANVVGTAVGLYLIRKAEAWPSSHGPGPHSDTTMPPVAPAPRNFANSEVRPYSWPCILVLVRDWMPATQFGADGVDPNQMIPRTLYLPDGRAAPVCVVQVSPGEPRDEAPANTSWPAAYIGGGFPIEVEVQGARHVASVGCLVTDGHKTYALTNRHISGEPGQSVQARVRGNLVEIGRSSAHQLTRLPFAEVFPEFPGRRSFLTMDIGLVELDAVDDWTSQPFGLAHKVGDVADFNELNIGLQLIDQPVNAFGAASGALEGRVKALFYRHKSLAGYEYISEFLIAPDDGAAQTRRGDSGTVWHLLTKTRDAAGAEETLLRPMAVEWGGQTILGAGEVRFNFALASGLSTACGLLDVDLVRDHNTGANPFWGQTGHYTIATAAIEAVHDRGLKALLEANVERISFRPDQLSPAEIKAKLANGDFVELADVPDLVWKKTQRAVPGGRDVAPNSGPEHPTHYADIDAPGANDGPSLRELTLRSIDNMEVAVWQNWYAANGQTDSRHQGLLPFRVWQFFRIMVKALQAGDVPRFICAAGILSHYVGDACQPLHGSFMADGFKDPADPQAKTWPGKGVHSTFETKMVDRFSAELLSMIGPKAAAFAEPIPPIRTGQEAGFATVTLMAHAADVLAPKDLCDEYIRLGGGASGRVVQGMWDAFADQTATVMGAGARYLAALWDAAFAVAATPLGGAAGGAVPEKTLAAIYQDLAFAPSLTLDKIAPELAPPAEKPPPVRRRAAGAAGRAARPRQPRPPKSARSRPG